MIVCSEKLRLEGKPYSRTCPTCFPGQCKYFAPKKEASGNITQSVAEATMALRFVHLWAGTQERIILQQQWIVREGNSIRYEWQDVPDEGFVGLTGSGDAE